MIRIILWRMGGSADWNEGVLHSFQQGVAVIEILATGELQLVPIGPDTLKFQIKTTDWVDMQVKMQQEAMKQEAQHRAKMSPGIVTVPNLSFGKH
jgi:hypothetical protein